MMLPLQRAIGKAGSQKALAEQVEVSQQAISKWLKNGGVVPAETAVKIERATGVTRRELRPDLFEGQAA